MEPYGRGARSQTEMISQAGGDRKPLCNLVRLEIVVAIKPTGLKSTCVLLLFCSVRVSELLWTPLIFVVSTGVLISPGCLHVLEYFQLLNTRGAQCERIQRVSEGDVWLVYVKTALNMWRLVVSLAIFMGTKVPKIRLCAVFFLSLSLCVMFSVSSAVTESKKWLKYYLSGGQTKFFLLNGCSNRCRQYLLRRCDICSHFHRRHKIKNW